MKQLAIAVIVEITRFWMRHSPFQITKASLYRWFEQYAGWRSLSGLTRTCFGACITFQYPDIIQKRIHMFGFWEPDITSYIQKVLKAGDTFVDVGSNIGYYALLASRLTGSNGRVYAFEASPSIFTILSDNIRRNKATNVYARNIAIADIKGKLQIFRADSDNLGGSTTENYRAEKDGMTSEGCVDAEPLLEAMPKADLFTARLIKIDIEGAERSVLTAVLDDLVHFSNQTEWLIEFTTEGEKLVEEEVRHLLDRFKAAGYNAYQIYNNYRVKTYIDGLPEPNHVRIRQLSFPLPPLLDVLLTRSLLPESDWPQIQ